MMNVRKATTIVQDLARQDLSGDVDDSYARTLDARDTIQRWYAAARMAGDTGVIEAIDLLGQREAAVVYERVRTGVQS